MANLRAALALYFAYYNYCRVLQPPSNLLAARGNALN